jgi:mono/diheme cytochrome c family protein
MTDAKILVVGNAAHRQQQPRAAWRQSLQWGGRGVTVLGSIFLGMTLVAAQSPPRLPGGTVSAGQQYFARYCSACHGEAGRGDGPAAPALRTPPADLTRLAQRRGGRFPVADIAAYIDGRTVVPAHGSREMPIWGERFGEMVGGGSVGEEVVRGNLLVLIEYLQSIQQ